MLPWLVLAASSTLAARADTSSAALVSTAEEAPPSRSTFYVMPGGALNPEAAVVFVGLERREVYQGPGRLLFRDLYYQYGAEVMLGALLRPAVHAEWLPIRVFKLRLQYELWYWPGFALGRGHGLVFSGKDAPFDPAELRRRQGEEIAGVGHRLALQPTLQMKVGPVVAFSALDLAALYIHGPQSFWREPLNDNLIARGRLDGTLKTTTVLAWELWAGAGDTRALLGALHEYVRTFEAGIRRHRLGGIIVLAPWTELAFIDRPQLFFLAGWNHRDRNRQGEGWMQVALRLDHDLGGP